ncbi:nucleoside triphosphate pyrophosphohydrolase [Peptostreptococcus faecalis]|uniref:nucleoside triphosphate pyrophosphohydrolase n=1 Tax=Peptostreptococcus faecalis TaxID=2045015 RepID=UPI000C7B0AA5|nr:nucleoside triphosphate pyrophosphohydrolase [Peptostreptococcus faecalis]
MSVKIVGLGAGDISQISFGAKEALMNSEKNYLRTKEHPVVEKLDIEYESFDSYYEEGKTFEDVYEQIAHKIIAEGKDKDIVYAVPGHPRVAEIAVSIIEKLANKENIELEVIPSMSFVDAMFNFLGFDPSEGFRLLDAFKIVKKDLDCDSNIIITQVYDRFIASNIKLALMEYYTDDQDIWIVSSAGVKGLELKKKVKLSDLDRVENKFDHLTSLFIEKSSNKKYENIYDLVEVVKELRGDNGCPWDKKQTHESLIKYLIEESYEVVDSIENDDIDLLIEELGDVLYQIVLHSQIGSEEGYFDFDEVCDTVSKKMKYRHPNVFEDSSQEFENKEQNWEELKMNEKDENTISEGLNRIPKSLPALMKAEKIQSKIEKSGILLEKNIILEKTIKKFKQFLNAIENEDSYTAKDNVGELIFYVISLAKTLNISSEQALNSFNDKFVKNFEDIENKRIEEDKGINDSKSVIINAYLEAIKNKK